MTIKSFIKKRLKKLKSIKERLVHSAIRWVLKRKLSNTLKRLKKIMKDYLF